MLGAYRAATALLDIFLLLVLLLVLHAPEEPTRPILVPPTARSALLAPTPLQLALLRVSNALVGTTAPQTLPHGLVSIAAEAITAPPALVLQHSVPTKCLQLADGVLCKSKALHSSWKQLVASTTASGTSHQATAC